MTEGPADEQRLRVKLQNTRKEKRSLFEKGRVEGGEEKSRG